MNGTLLVTVVEGGPTQDGGQVDTVVAGAKTELLWDIDALSCDRLTTELSKKIGTFYRSLDNSLIHHSSVYLSSDASRFKGLPIENPPQDVLLLWSSSNVVADFQWRTRHATQSDSHMTRRRNSPIWSMHRFYQQEPSLAHLWHGDYQNERVPVDAVFVVHRNDQYARYAASSPIESKWKVEDYAKAFLDLHRKRSKKSRVDVITTDDPCPAEDCELRDLSKWTRIPCEKAGYPSDFHCYKCFYSSDTGDKYRYVLITDASCSMAKFFSGTNENILLPPVF